MIYNDCARSGQKSLGVFSCEDEHTYFADLFTKVCKVLTSSLLTLALNILLKQSFLNVKLNKREVKGWIFFIFIRTGGSEMTATNVKIT